MNDNTPAFPEPDVSAENPTSEHWIWAGEHRPAIPRALVEHMTGNWAEVLTIPQVHPSATFCAQRRTRIGAAFANRTIVIPTGNFKVRANDTDYRFRPGTDFFYLTGCDEPDAVLVITSGDSGSRFHPVRRAPSRSVDPRVLLRRAIRRTVGRAPSRRHRGGGVLRDRHGTTREPRKGPRHSPGHADRVRTGFRRVRRLDHRSERGRQATRDGVERDATRQGRIRDCPTAARRRLHGQGLRGRRARPPRGGRSRRTSHRRRLQPSRARRRQRRRLRHHRRQWFRCDGPALDEEHRRGPARRPLIARRGRRMPQPVHRRRHAHHARQREVLRAPARDLRTRPQRPSRPASTR